MTRSRPLVLLGLLSAVLAALAMWLLLHNPKVEGPSTGEYTCAAPYDTALNDADNVPGGEPPVDADAVEAACVDTGKTRFTQGVIAGLGAVVLAAVAASIAVRARWSAPKAPVTK